MSTYTFKANSTKEIDFHRISSENIDKPFVIKGVLFMPQSLLDKNSYIKLCGMSTSSEWGDAAVKKWDVGINGFALETTWAGMKLPHHRAKAIDKDKYTHDDIKRTIDKIRSYVPQKRVKVEIIE